MKIPVPRHIQMIVPYTKSRPTLRGGEFQVKHARLAANENPLGPSPRAAEAIKNYLHHVHRYPDAAMDDLRDAIAMQLGLSPESVICGNGSNEVMELAMRCFFRQGEEALFPWPSFVIYKQLTQFAGGVPVAVPVRADFHADVDAILSRVTARTRVVFLGNPNNPTGLLLPRDELFRLLDGVPAEVLIVLDEAYIQFKRDDDYPASTELVGRYANLLVVRSFSKFYGLAGLRVGIGFGHPELVGYLDRVRQPYNVNVLGQIGALAALADTQHAERTLALVQTGRVYLADALESMGVRFVPSHANFLLVDVERDGREVGQRLYELGVEVRPMADYGLVNHIRVSVGLSRENEMFIEALRKVLGR